MASTSKKNIRCGSSTRSRSRASVSTSARRPRRLFFRNWFCADSGRELSSRFVVTERDTLYLSPVHLTPYSAGRERVDEQALGRLVDAAYQDAGLTPRDIDTGAIILTGEAIRRDNARAIADLFAAQRGNFVCATAGHNFEALLAAHGSGAVAYSAEKQCRVLNVDIGGGTTKLAVAECGRVLSTAAFHVGGRLLATDGAGTITLLEPGGQALARQVGFDVADRQPGGECRDRASGESHGAGNFQPCSGRSAKHPSLLQLWLTAPLSGRRTTMRLFFPAASANMFMARSRNHSAISARRWDEHSSVE